MLMKPDKCISVWSVDEILTGEYFQSINGMRFTEGFLYKTISMTSISTQHMEPSFDEVEKFQQRGKNRVGDVGGLLPFCASREKEHLMLGDKVVVVKGDLKSLQGRIERVTEDTIHIRPNATGLKGTLVVDRNAVCKYSEPGKYVKVISGAAEGAMGMVVKVEGPHVVVLTDATKEHMHVFAKYIVEM